MGENAVFRLDRGEAPALCLRLHRADGHDQAEVESELRWMAALIEDTDLCLPAPHPTLVTRTGDADWPLASMMQWLEGTPLPSPPDVATQRVIGAALAKLHQHACAWTPPAGFSRPRFQADRTLGQSMALDLDRVAQVLPAPAGEALRPRWAEAVDLLAALPCAPPSGGLCHADLQPGNLLRAPSGLGLLDFDDALFAPFAYDLVTAAASWLRLAPGSPPIAAQLGPLLQGYAAHRAPPPLAPEVLHACALSRALGVTSWAWSRAVGASADWEALRAALCGLLEPEMNKLVVQPI
ncbi:MAG: phosphotransferase [Alphaproteobacteria bacterium]|nr:phosphotransferase [Alphaproteobacteria bacterium]